jgi:hypothetical protein
MARNPTGTPEGLLRRDSDTEAGPILFLTGQNAFVIQKQTKDEPLMVDERFYFYFYGFLGGFDFSSSTQRPLT